MYIFCIYQEITEELNDVCRIITWKTFYFTVSIRDRNSFGWIKYTWDVIKSNETSKSAFPQMVSTCSQFWRNNINKNTDLYKVLPRLMMGCAGVTVSRGQDQLYIIMLYIPLSLIWSTVIVLYTTTNWSFKLDYWTF